MEHQHNFKTLTYTGYYKRTGKPSFFGIKYDRSVLYQMTLCSCGEQKEIIVHNENKDA